MVDEDLAAKCRKWVEDYCGVNHSTPENTQREVNSRIERYRQPNQNTPRSVSNRTERHYERPTCWLEKPSWVDRDYHLVKVANLEVRINTKSRMSKFDANSLEGIFRQFEESSFQYAYLVLPRLFCSIIGKEPTLYCDEYVERNVETLVSELKRMAIREAEAIGAELAIMERDKIELREKYSGFVHGLTIKLGKKYSFQYSADARTEFYKRNM